MLVLLVLLPFCEGEASVAFPFDKVTFIGRWWSSGGAMQASWGTASFVLTFRGSTSLSAKLQPLTSPREMYFEMHHTCHISTGVELGEGGQEVKLVRQARASEMVIKTDLDASKTYTVWCGRNTEAYYGKTILEALMVDAAAEFLPPPRLEGQLRVEFIGDSITAGWKVLNGPGSSSYENEAGEDIFLTWDRRLADAWKTADWRAVARTGIAILPYEAWGIQFQAMKDRFQCSEYVVQLECPRPWDFDLWQPDVVVINMGTNDFIPNNPNKPTASFFQAKYLELLQVVRSKYPESLLLCIMPLAYTCNFEANWDNLYEGVSGAVKSFSEEDAKIRLYDTGSRQAPWLNCWQDYVDGIHPTIEGGKKFASKLLPGMTPDIRQFYPEKCPGSGPTCGSAGEPPATTVLTTGSVSTTQAPQTTTGRPSTTAATGTMECCFPDCVDSGKVCLDASHSSWCTLSAANCEQCGNGQLCPVGGPPPPTVSTTSAPLTSSAGAGPTSSTSAVGPATTASTGQLTTGSAVGSMECCFPDCADAGRVCLDASQSSWCTLSAANCEQCGNGQLCPVGRPVPQTSSSTSIPATTIRAGPSSSTAAAGSSVCCFPDCADENKACITNSFCTSSPENCRRCGDGTGELCQVEGSLLRGWRP